MFNASLLSPAQTLILVTFWPYARTATEATNPSKREIDSIAKYMRDWTQSLSTDDDHI